MENTKPENRVPVALTGSGDELHCQWINTYDKRFTEPFFSNTVLRLKFLHHIKKGERVVGSLHEMQQQAQSINALSPSFIIFHLSRCGSTLISQMFATSGRFIVLSEVPFFDELLRIPFVDAGFDKTSIPAIFSSALKFYSRKKDPAEEYLVVKTDCWHIFFYETLRKIFPAVPFVLMYRSPDEVLTSNLKIAGWQTVPELVDPRIFGLPGIPEVYQREIYSVTIIEKMLAKFLEVAETDQNCTLVNYNEGALNVVKKIAGLTNIALNDEEIEIMKQRSAYHSKNPGELFSEEPAAEVPACLNEAMRLYEVLETRRGMG